MVTLSDVATLAGVSISAASRVLSNAPATRVRPETRDRIHAAARELDYRPNFAGRALKFARSNVIALIVPDLTNALFTELMTGVEEAAIERDYTVLLGRSENMQPGGDAIARLLGEGRVDGLLVQLRDGSDVQGIESLLRAKAPVIFINSVADGPSGAVVLDDGNGARVATEHLIALGHTRIAMAGGSPSTFSAQRRKSGFRAAMADAGLPVLAQYVTSLGYSPAEGRAAMRTLMGLEEPPTAVFIANVNAAIGALGEARSLHLSIPEDVSVVALHDAWTAENAWPPLTTVEMPQRQMGRQAVQLLHERLLGGDAHNVVVDDPAPRLIVRESTSSPAASALSGAAGTGPRSGASVAVKKVT
jgi:LacI family transcriptional regulator